MRCPVCRRETTWKGNPFRPFCSERCKLIDLDNWLSERYRIAAREDEESSGAPPESHEVVKESRD
jgi:endogenous inhibitor of DNA gyrase (YacG/DUF329 family)